MTPTNKPTHSKTEPDYNNAADVLLEYLQEMVNKQQFPEVAHYKDWLFYKAKKQIERRVQA